METWDCPVCTFVNPMPLSSESKKGSLDAVECEICLFRLPLIRQPIPSQAFITSNQDNTYCWRCASCNYSNSNNWAECDICGEARPLVSTSIRKRTPPPIPARSRGFSSPSRLLNQQQQQQRPQFQDHSQLRHITDSNSDSKGDNRAKDTIARRQVIEEIVSTETYYVECLSKVVETFYQPLSDSNIYNIDTNDMKTIFGDFPSLFQLHSMLLQELKVAATHQEADQIAAAFSNYAPYLKMYTGYMNTYESRVNLVHEVMYGQKKVKKFLDKARKRTPLSLMDYLIMPVQRLPRYTLLLRALKDCVPDISHQSAISKSLDNMESLCNHINESKRQVENLTKLVDIQARISHRDLVLVQPNRRLIREGLLSFVSIQSGLSNTKVNVFLFSDLLLWTSEQDTDFGSLDLTAPTTHLTSNAGQASGNDQQWQISLNGDPNSFQCSDPCLLTPKAPSIISVTFQFENRKDANDWTTRTQAVLRRCQQLTENRHRRGSSVAYL